MRQTGFPIMESYPRQCRAGVKVFVEDIDANKPVNQNKNTASPECKIVGCSGQCALVWTVRTLSPLANIGQNMLAIRPLGAKSRQQAFAAGRRLKNWRNVLIKLNKNYKLRFYYYEKHQTAASSSQTEQRF